jgi:hypothetical protein
MVAASSNVRRLACIIALLWLLESRVQKSFYCKPRVCAGADRTRKSNLDLTE